MSQKRTVQTQDGTAEGRLFLPDEGSGPWPVIVFFDDAGGSRPVMWAMGKRLANAGYAVIQPDFYWRSGPYAEFDGRTAFADPAERARLGALVSAVRTADVVADARLFLDSLAADPRLRTGAVGVVGYCMGGRLGFVLASQLGEVAAVAAIHAGGLVTHEPDSPHLAARSIRGEVYLGVAEADASCTDAHQGTLRTALSEAGVTFVLDNYRARHGWTVADFAAYDETAAERHWDRILDLFRRTL